MADPQLRHADPAARDRLPARPAAAVLLRRGRRGAGAGALLRGAGASPGASRGSRTVGGRPLPGSDPGGRPARRTPRSRDCWCSRVYAWAALALMPGQDLLTNPIFGFVFVWMWVGLVPISLLLGQFWRATNPLRTMHGGLCALARVDPRQGLLRLPRRVGVWPAAAGPVRLRLARAGPAGPHHAGRAAGLGPGLAGDHDHRGGRLRLGAGSARPIRSRPTPSTVAQLSPWRRVGGQLRLVESAGRPERLAPHRPARPAVVAALLGSTAFDSFANTSWWIQTVQNSDVITVVWGTARPARP